WNPVRHAEGAGMLAAVVVYAVGRLSRRQAETLTLLEEFAAHGAGTASACQPFDTTNPMGGAMIGFLASFAELQREDIRARTRVALRRKRDQGEPAGRSAFGVKIAADAMSGMPRPGRSSGASWERGRLGPLSKTHA